MHHRPHDLLFGLAAIEWEAAPTLNPEVGYPRGFTEVAPQEYICLWGGAKHPAMPMGRSAALLVSLHGMGLYERFTGWKKSPESTRVVEAFLQQEKAFQRDRVTAIFEGRILQAEATDEPTLHDRLAHAP